MIMTEMCTINDKWTYNGMRVVYLENDTLKIGVLAGRGSDIFEFIYKPKGINLLLKLKKDILNPNKVFSQQRDEPYQFEDYYYGGWQEILPNSAPMNFHGARLGQHGEVSLIPWDFSILENSKNKVSLKLWTRPLRVPILVEKVLTLENGKSTLFIEERLINESNKDLHIMWGQHIALGIPLVEKGAKLYTNATSFKAEPSLKMNSFYQKGTFKWPMVKNITGETVDASEIKGTCTKGFSELAYLSNFKGDGAYYEVMNDDLSFRVSWDDSVFKSLWYWQERYSTFDRPWWGNTFAVALEPWSSNYHPNPTHEVIENEWLKIPANKSVETDMTVECKLRLNN